MQLIDKFGSRASRYAATGTDGPDSAVDGPEVWAAHYFDDELWVFLGPCTQVQGLGVMSTGTWPPKSGAYV